MNDKVDKRFGIFKYIIYLCSKLKRKMNDDIFESVSQRGRGEEIAENRRIYEVADELFRRCQLYEAQFHY